MVHTSPTFTSRSHTSEPPSADSNRCSARSRFPSDFHRNPATPGKSRAYSTKREHLTPIEGHNTSHAPGAKKQKLVGETQSKPNKVDREKIDVKHFTFRELASATKNFRPEYLLGEGGFSRVYKGTLQGGGQVVAVKQLDRNGLHENQEFLDEVMTMSLVCHDNLVNILGYCANVDQRLLVYEWTVEDHLLDVGPNEEPLDWFMRMKIVYGAAKGLEYLHGSCNPPIINGYLESTYILLGKKFKPKLSDFGLAKLGSADPLPQGKFPEKDLNQAVAIAAMCLQEHASVRPLMSVLVTALSFLSGASYERPCSSLADPELHSPEEFDGETEHDDDSDSRQDYCREHSNVVDIDEKILSFGDQFSWREKEYSDHEDKMGENDYQRIVLEAK
ncbi:hypothetical protein NL676_012898 [Syzygium grande]|nr:hypothetical protein NL676_012898 [Syzygium grande]